MSEKFADKPRRVVFVDTADIAEFDSQASVHTSTSQAVEQLERAIKAYFRNEEVTSFILFAINTNAKEICDRNAVFCAVGGLFTLKDFLRVHTTLERHIVSTMEIARQKVEK
jgi:hypothetical protein